MCRMYYVHGTNCDGYDRDLFVSANSPSEAVDIMLVYYEIEDAATEFQGDKTIRVYTVPIDTSKLGAIEWARISCAEVSIPVAAL